MIKELWWQKHRPKSLKGFAFQNSEHKRIIKKFIEDKSIPHLLFQGAKGSGKTTLAKIIINSLVSEEDQESDVLTINGSTHGKIDDIRSMVLAHVSTVPMGEIKIVFIDEADGLSDRAQEALRGVLEQCDNNARVIFTCNYINKLTPELRSRFHEFKFTPLKKDDLLEIAAAILLKEGVSLKEEEDLDNLNAYIDFYSSDLRKLILALESGNDEGKLLPPNLDNTVVSYGVELLELIGKNNWIKARELIAENVNDEDLLEVYRFLYEYLEEIEKFKDENNWKKGIVIISDYMYRHSFHVDPEINFAGCLIKLVEV